MFHLYEGLIHAAELISEFLTRRSFKSTKPRHYRPPRLRALLHLVIFFSQSWAKNLPVKSLASDFHNEDAAAAAVAAVA